MLATATPPASTTRSPPPSAPTESFPAARRRKAPRTRIIDANLLAQLRANAPAGAGCRAGAMADERVTAVCPGPATASSVVVVLGRFDEWRDQLCRLACPIRLDPLVSHPGAQPPPHLGRQSLRRRIVVLRRWRSPIAAQAMGHVEVLLEVVAQRDVDKRTAIRDQLHGRRQPALHYRQVAARQGLEKVVHVASCLHAIDGWKVVGVDARSADQQQLCLRNLGAKNAKRLDDAVQEMDTYRRSSHRGDDQHAVGIQVELAAQLLAIGQVLWF